MILGHYELVRIDDHVWIRNLTTGEAGRWPVAEVAAVVERLFAEGF